MKITSKHNFSIPETFDDILLSIEKYGENLEKLDELVDEIVPNINVYLIDGQEYKAGQKVWNEAPSVGDYVGWVNLRTGLHAPKWMPNRKYNVGDIVIPTINNGHYYQCIESGTSSPLEPNFPISSNEEIEDIKNITFWEASKVYEVGDIVRKNAGGKAYYYQCVIAGTSDTVEPNWSDIEGTTIVDGSVHWYVYKTVKWKEAGISCEFRPFGKIE